MSGRVVGSALSRISRKLYLIIGRFFLIIIFIISTNIRTKVIMIDNTAYPIALKSSEPVEKRALIAVAIESAKFII